MILNILLKMTRQCKIGADEQNVECFAPWRHHKAQEIYFHCCLTVDGDNCGCVHDNYDNDDNDDDSYGDGNDDGDSALVMIAENAHVTSFHQCVPGCTVWRLSASHIDGSD